MSERPPEPLADDPAVAALQSALQDVDARPVAERVAVFEQLNDGIARELARLDEV